MVQRLIAQHFCDVCLEASEEQPVTFAETVSIGKASLHLDLCERHEKELVADLRETLNRFRKPIRTTPRVYNKTESPVNCPSCDMIFRGRAGLSAHTRTKHVAALTS